MRRAAETSRPLRRHSAGRLRWPPDAARSAIVVHPLARAHPPTGLGLDSSQSTSLGGDSNGPQRECRNCESGDRQKAAGPPGDAACGGKRLPQWQHEISSSGRAFYCPDLADKVVWVTSVDLAHPKETE